MARSVERRRHHVRDALSGFPGGVLLGAECAGNRPPFGDRPDPRRPLPSWGVQSIEWKMDRAQENR